MGEPDLYGALTAPDDEAAMRQARMIAARLRGQDVLGNILALSGDKQIGGLGQRLNSQAQAGMTQVNGLPMQRMQLAQKQEQTQRLADERQDLADPATAQTARAVFSRFLPDVDVSQTPARALLNKLIPVAEKGYAVDENAAARRAQTADRLSAQDSQKLDKRFTEFANSLNVMRGRQGEAGKLAGGLNQIERDMALANTPNLTKQQLYELVRGLDRVVSGGAATIGATEHLMPQTLRGMLSNGAQWLTNEPVGAGAESFVQQIKDTLQRVKGANQKALSQTMAQSVTGYSDLARKDKDRFLAQLQAAGLNHEEFDPQTWVYKGPPQAQPAVAPAGGPPRVTSQAEYDALPAGADYVDASGAPHRKGGKH